jgi:two-component system, LytTR family, response regulator
MSKVAVIDDERLARKYLKQLLAEHPSLEFVGEAENVNEGARLCEQAKPDLVFLDVQMPGADGFDLLARLNPVPKVIFVTAYAEYAVRAFDVQAVDYLLKPVSPERMLQALKRAGALPGEAKALTLDDSVCLRDGTRVVVTPLRDIVAIEAQADYTRVRFTTHAPLLVHRRMREWESLLPESTFARLDRSLFVNLTAIARLESTSRDEGLLYLSYDKDPLPLGRVAIGRARTLLSGR